MSESAAEERSLETPGHHAGGLAGAAKSYISQDSEMQDGVTGQ